MNHDEVTAFDFVNPNTLLALDTLSSASDHLRSEFHIMMSRVEAQANLDARAILFNLANDIFRSHGCAISREEVEGAWIIARELGS